MPSTGAISLAEIMSHHRDLLVHPICWTSRHLEMLGCRFEHIDHAPTYDIEPEANTCQPVDNGKVLEEQAETNLFHEEGFAEGSFSLCPDLDFGCLVRPLLNRKCETPYFFFANKRIHQPLYSVYYRSRKRSQPADKAPRPIIGYMHYRGVENYRQRMFPFRDHPKGLSNRPGGQIHLKRVAQITPKNWSEDPYLLCVLLSLAQLQEYHRKEWHPPVHISRLFLTYKRGEEFFHVFEARITSELLRMLDNPTTATQHIEWPVIKHKRVPRYPIEGLRERIQAEITLDQQPGTFDISDPVHPVLLPSGIREYPEDADTIQIQRRKEVKKKTKKKVKKESSIVPRQTLGETV